MSARDAKVSKGTVLLLVGIGLVIIDQVIKILVKTNMSIGENFNVIGQWFKIYFIENEGMAFGMKFGGSVGKFMLSLFRIVLFGALVYWIRALLKKPGTPSGVTVGLTLIAAGALGNIIDSVFYGVLFSESTHVPATFLPAEGGYASLFYGKVVDMFYFPIIDTYWPEWVPFVGGDHFIFFSPIFNFADAAISCGVIALLLFYSKYWGEAYHAVVKKHEEKKKNSEV